MSKTMRIINAFDIAIALAEILIPATAGNMG